MQHEGSYFPEWELCLKSYSKRLAEAFLGEEGGRHCARASHCTLVLTLLQPHLLPGPGGWTRSTSTTPGDPNTAQLPQRVIGTRPSSLDAGSKLPPSLVFKRTIKMSVG